MSGQRSILIVEDEPLIAMMLEDFLDSLGHKVSGTCDTVKCALDEVEKGGFDLAILDVNLKGENVWPVATRLRERNVPFVIATGGDRKSTRLNSSHSSISYAVFCLKKKNIR